MKWIPFDGHHKLPKERQPVLVKIMAEEGHESGGVAMGYLRYSGGERALPYFVCVGMMFKWHPTHWADCLPEDFFESVPGWNWPKSSVHSKPSERKVTDA
jgi:hypothetical protein